MTVELASWHEGPAKQAIIDFVAAVTAEKGAYYVAPDDRLAVFDNDGTLWSERPIYFQLIFAIDRVREMAPDHPEWAATQPFQAVIEDDMETLAGLGMAALVELVAATHTGMTTREFAQIVEAWITTARHPTTGPPVHGDGIPADAGTAALPAPPRLHDLYRLRRRHRFYARLVGACLRHPTAAGDRHQRGDRV